MMQHYPILAIMTYFLGAFLIVIFGKNRTVRNAVGFLATAVPLCLLITLVKPVMMGGDIIAYWMGGRVPAGGYAIGIALEVDALSLFFGLLVATAVFAAMLYSFSYMSHDDNEPQYYTLFLMLCGGVMGLVLSGDLFNMFIMVEILTFAAVALTAFRNTVFGALEAAFKYLVVGSIGSSCILAGTIMLYAQAHTLNFAQLSAMIPGNLTKEEKKIYRAIGSKIAVNDCIWNEGVAIPDICKKIAAKSKPDVPTLLFVSNGKGLGVKDWTGLQKDYANGLTDSKVVEYACGHYVHDFEYENISKEIREFLKSR